MSRRKRSTQLATAQPTIEGEVLPPRFRAG